MNNKKKKKITHTRLKYTKTWFGGDYSYGISELPGKNYKKKKKKKT